MKRTVLLFMALLVGILLPLQSVQSLNYPWRNNFREVVSEDHPWGGDITDPGGSGIKPGPAKGFTGMSIIGRFVGYSMPIILKLYTKRFVSPAPTVQNNTPVTPSTPAPSGNAQTSGGK